MIDALIPFAGGALATYYGWRPIATGPNHLEWVEWHRKWGRTVRIVGPCLIATSLIQILFR